MSKRIINYLLLFILAGILALLQFSLVSAWMTPWSNLNLAMVAVIFAFLALGRDRAWFLALAIGWFLDVFGFHPFGLSLLSLFLSAVLVYLVLENLLTNRSLYSFLLLTAIGVLAEAIFYNLLLLVVDWSGATGQFFLISNSFWTALFWNLLSSLLLIGLFFNLLALASHRLKPFFLKRR